jgi:hypothetical protein
MTESEARLLIEAFELAVIAGTLAAVAANESNLQSHCMNMVTRKRDALVDALRRPKSE